MTRLPNYKQMCDAIASGEPFAFSRWGDGEWSCILGDKGENCDGHAYYPSLGLALADVLKSHPPYILGMQPKAMRGMGARITTWANREVPDIGTLRWINADVIHDASTEGKMPVLFDAIKARKRAATGVSCNVVLVGPPHINAMKDHLGDDIWIVNVRAQNCWATNRAVLQELKDVVDKSGVVVLFCAGMASKVWIDALYYARKDTTLVDVGSAFDPWCGVLSRKYHHKLKMEKIA